MSNVLTEFNRRLSRDGRLWYCTKAGGLSDEVNWEYSVHFPEDALPPIEAVLMEYMSAQNKVRWELQFAFGHYSAKICTWRVSELRGETPEELAQEMEKHFLRMRATLSGGTLKP